MRALGFAVRFAGDDGLHSVPLTTLNNLVQIAGFVSQQGLGWSVLQQPLDGLAGVALPWLSAQSAAGLPIASQTACILVPKPPRVIPMSWRRLSLELPPKLEVPCSTSSRS